MRPLRMGKTFILAGSIRDDGPLPEVITDTVKAKDAMDKALRGVDMTIMLGHHASFHRRGQFAAILCQDHLRRYQSGDGYQAHGQGIGSGHRPCDGYRHIPAPTGRGDR